MAILNGFLSTSIIYSGIVNSNISSELFEFTLSNWPPHDSAIGSTPKGALITHWPVAANNVSIAGFNAGSYADDFYYRIHVIPARLDLGNIVSTQTSAVTLWNAYLTPVTMTALSGIDEGVELSGQPSAPVAFNGLQERVWNLAVTPDGPAILDAKITWVFNNGDEAVLVATGNRISAFTWPPNWENGIRERLTWATDILQSRTGAEQRRALRLTPRRELDAEFLLHARERQYFDIAMFGWASRVWAVPFWPDIQLLTTAIVSNATVIPCATTYYDFRVGGLALLQGETPFQYETVEIESIASNQLRLARPLINSWAAGTRLYPVRIARLQQAPQLARANDMLQSTGLNFMCVEPNEWPAAMPGTTYMGWPVFDARPDESEDLTSQYQHLLLTLDNGSAAATITDTANLAFPTQLHRWFLAGRTERASLRSFIYALNGRQKAVWLTTHADDLTVVSIISDAAVTIDVAAIGYTRFGQAKPGRRDIRVQLRNGTVFYRRITGSAEISSDAERLQLNASFGVVINPTDIERISWLMLMRSDSDSIEIQHETDSAGLATVSQVFRGVRDDDV